MDSSANPFFRVERERERERERESEREPNIEKNRATPHTYTNNGGGGGGAAAEVVVQISGCEETSNKRKDSNVELTELDNPKPKVQTSSSSSPEIIKFSSPSPNRPPKIPTTETLVRRVSLARTSTISKPKSRFVEPSVPYSSAGSVEENNKLHQLMQEGAANSPTKSPHTSSSFKFPVTPRTPFLSSPGGEEEEEEIQKSDNVHRVIEKSRKRIRLLAMIEWSALVLILGFLVASLTVHHLDHAMIWGLEIWKWSVLVFVIVCGRLVTDWFIHFLVFLIERNFLLKTKVLYFVYGLKNSVQVFIWLGLVLLSWALLINRGVKRSRKATKVLNYVSRVLASFLIAAVIWLVKTLLMKLLAASFHVNTFFERIQESIFHQYVLQTLSGPPLMELAQSIGGSKSVAQVSFRNTGGKGQGGKEPEKFDVDQLSKMKQDKVSAWTMRKLVDMVRTQGLSTISNTIDQIDSEREQREKEITSEWEAKTAANIIFRNVATHSKYISEDDLLRFLNKDEVANVLPLFEGAVETRKIKRSALRNWVVKVYLDRKSLAHSLNDTKTAVKQLNNIVTAIVIVVIIIVWFLVMGFATIKVFLFISSQMLVVAFMFGNTVKTMFESIIFVFVMHPFDVGDRCVIDGVQMIVEEMNILTTVFLRYDNEKIYYPNSVLAIKPISNFYRSPDMGDSVDFSIDVSTPFDTITSLKNRIKSYIDGKPQYWRPNHSVVVKEIENMNKMKMALYVTHTMNHQNFGEKNNRRTELVLEMKKIFEDLHIQYHLLPQEVRLSYVGPAAAALISNGR